MKSLACPCNHSKHDGRENRQYVAFSLSDTQKTADIDCNTPLRLLGLRVKHAKAAELLKWQQSGGEQEESVVVVRFKNGGRWGTFKLVVK